MMEMADVTALDLYAVVSRVRVAEDEFDLHWRHFGRKHSLGAHEDLIADYWKIKTKKNKHERHRWVDSLLATAEVEQMRAWLAGEGTEVLAAAGLTLIEVRAERVALPVPKTAPTNDPVAGWAADCERLHVGQEQGLPFPAVGTYLMTESMRSERLRKGLEVGRRTLISLQDEIRALLAGIEAAIGDSAMGNADAAGDQDHLRKAYESYLQFQSRMGRKFRAEGMYG